MTKNHGQWPFRNQRQAWERTAWMVLLAAVACSAVGCAAGHPSATTPAIPLAQLKTATKDQLIAAYNGQANALQSINASVSMKLTAGTAYSGVIKQYHEVNGFLLAQRPASIRVIGQLPVVGTNIFDMASDGATFRINIPSKNKFLEGPANLQRQSAQPVENLRPQHLVDAVFWAAIPADAPVLFEAGDESEARYYVLTVAQEPAQQPPQGNSEHAGSIDWIISRKIWFDRADLSISRLQIYDSGGNVTADMRYSSWDTFGTVRFAGLIRLVRPGEDYGLDITIKKLTPNQPIAADKFELQQPPGTELVHVGEQNEEPQL
jgi:hypothetical protein